MVTSQSKEFLDLKAIITITILSALWGFNYTAIKFTNEGIAPVFASTLRSLIASICGVIYCLHQKQKLFHTDIMLFHGFIVGLLFGLEFACIYFGMLYTDAARSVVFVYTNPFVVAIGAHLFIRGDRLSVPKIIGLIIAFAGIYIVFQGRPKAAKETMLLGDVLQIMAAIFWGATTVYIKKFMAEKILPINTFLYQLIFSTPILFIVSLILERDWIYQINFSIVTFMFYQSIIVPFMSYLIWFKLIHAYSVSRLSALRFSIHLWGPLGSFHEEFTASLMVGLPWSALESSKLEKKAECLTAGSSLCVKLLQKPCHIPSKRRHGFDALLVIQDFPGHASQPHIPVGGSGNDHLLNAEEQIQIAIDHHRSCSPHRNNSSTDLSF
jgi:drug/metabolite transporter (DMT)-like permease